jgi:hypothetical protein
MSRQRRRRKPTPPKPLDANPAAYWRFGIEQGKADNIREIRKAQAAGLGDVYSTLAAHALKEHARQTSDDS